jgi:cell division protease FtsH
MFMLMTVDRSRHRAYTGKQAVDGPVVPGTVGPTMSTQKPDPAARQSTGTEGNGGERRRAGLRRLVPVLLVFLFVSYIINGGRQDAAPNGEKAPLSEVLASVAAGTSVLIDEQSGILVVTYGDGTSKYSPYPAGAVDELLPSLQGEGVEVEVQPAQRPSFLPSLLLTLLPVGLILGFFILMSKRGGLGGMGSLGLNKTKSAPVEVPTTKFSDVAGVDEALEDLREVVDFLHNPERYTKIGAKRPRGFLLVGPPGTGKTLLARAVAGEAGVPFYAIAGADFVELFAGLGASRVRDLFTKARTQEKAIIFIDEIDAIGKARGRGMQTGVNDERENTLNALLVELDGFSRHDGIVILAATNRVDVLDPALLRPGRFDRVITVPAPDRVGRRKILELYATSRPFGLVIDWEQLARRTQGMTGAQLEQLLNEAALEAARQGSDEIQEAHLEAALATTVLGRERRSAVVSDRDRRIVAWHEAGHALAALLLEDADDPVRVSIIPRGGTGGATWMTGNEHDLVTRKQAHARLVVALSGRAAEEILLEGDYTQGAHGDLSMATRLATEMIARYGMGQRLVSRSEEKLVFDGPVSQEVDEEVDTILNRSLNQARELLTARRDLLDAIAGELLEKENLDLLDLQELERVSRAG